MDKLLGRCFTAVIKKDGNWWIGWIEEIPGVNCQERTKEELLESLKITLQEALEMNRQEALSLAEQGYEEEVIRLLSAGPFFSISESMDVNC